MEWIGEDSFGGGKEKWGESYGMSVWRGIRKVVWKFKGVRFSKRNDEGSILA